VSTPDPHLDQALSECVFCGLMERFETAGHVVFREVEWRRAPIRIHRIAPLNPVTAGHMLFVPELHVVTADASLPVAGVTMEAAAQWALQQRQIEPAYNLITSAGGAATQTVPHLHIHYVPRRDGDGLALPWTGQAR
jgi:histidine triad (HIT) family protein